MATSSSVSLSRRKLSLIIGNNNYSRPESQLRHCINDANDLSNLLQTIDFNVTTHYNLTNAEMISTLNSFSKIIHDDDLVLFYFSGHGYQVNGKNYLMPIDDANIETEDDVEDCAIPVERTIDRFAAKNSSSVTIFILDCCRKYWPKDIPKTKAMVEGKGMHMIDPPAGTFIQFACGADRTASDGLETDRNGLFTKHLLKHIANPNEDIVQIFQGIAGDVFYESGRKQKPLSINGLMRRGHVYLNELIAVNPESTYKNAKIRQFINENKNKSNIHLTIKQLTSEDMQIISHYLLRNNTILTRLRIYDTQIGDKGIQYLSDELQNNETLTDLLLAKNQIGDQGIQYLSDMLQNNKTIKELALSNNYIGAHGIFYLCKALKNNKTLRSLNLAYNHIGFQGLQYLNDVLQNNNTLIYLNLEDNQIGDDGRKLLSDFNNTHSSLSIKFLL